MCWFCKWKYVGRELRTCMVCGIHQIYARWHCEDSPVMWHDISCHTYATEVERYNDNNKSEHMERLRAIAERRACKYHGVK